MDWKLVAGLGDAHDLVDPREVEVWVNALGVEVQRQGDDVHVARAFTVAEQGSFDAVGTGQDGQLGSRHSGSPIIVRVYREDHMVSVGQLAMHPFDLIGVHVGRGHFHRRRKVDDRFTTRVGLPDLQYGAAGLEGEVELGSGEAFGRVLKHPIGVRLPRGMVSHPAGALFGDAPDSRSILPEYQAPLGFRRRVVDMNDGAAHTLQCLERPSDEIRARLGQDLNGDIGRNTILFDDFPYEVEVGLGGGRETDLDLLEANGHEHLEHLVLAQAVHGFDERLVAVP